MRKSLAAYLLALPALGWLLAFAVAPIAFMFVMSFWKSSMFGTKPDFIFDNYARLFTTPLYFGQLLDTLRIAALTTAISLVVSFPVALLLARLEGLAKAALVLLLFLPFWTSYVVRTFVWLPLLGRTGVVNQVLMSLGLISEPLDALLYSPGAVLFGLVYVYTLFMTLPIYLALDRLDPALIEAAEDLGARPPQILWRILIPLAMPGVMSGSLMVFLLAVGAYVTPQLLGGPDGAMYGTVIASQFLANNNWAFGSALAMTLMFVVLLVLIVAGRRVGLAQVLTGGKT